MRQYCNMGFLPKVPRILCADEEELSNLSSPSGDTCIEKQKEVDALLSNGRGIVFYASIIANVCLFIAVVLMGSKASSDRTSAAGFSSIIDNNGVANSCDLDGRRRQQLCGAAMLPTPWTENRTSDVPTALVPNPLCDRSLDSSTTFDQPEISLLTNEEEQMVMTFLMLYYEEPNYLSHQVAEWLSWSEETRGRFKFLIIDDGSRPGLQAAELLRPHLELIRSKIDVEVYHVDQDMCWNIAGARNLGAHLCRTEYFYLGDSDLLVSGGLAKYMLEKAEDAENTLQQDGIRTLTYRFNRKRFDRDEFKIHPAVCITSKSTYWYSGGADEDGFYTSGYFRHRALRSGVQFRKVNKEMDHHNIPPLRSFSSDTKVPCNMLLPNCNAMLQLKEDSHVARLSKPSVEQEHLLWDMKEQGLLPYSNTFLRFSWTKAFPL